MTDQDLRSKLVRLAHEKPELRPHLLPLLKESGEKTAVMTAALALPIKEAATLLVKSVGSRYPAEAEASFLVVLQTCVMFARRGVRDTVLTALLMKAEDRLSKVITARAPLDDGGVGADGLPGSPSLADY